MVVAIELSGMNLEGSLPASLANLTYLRLLDVSGNKLSGPLPVVAPPDDGGGGCAEAAQLRLTSNAFEYREAELMPLLSRCRGTGAGCGAGLPPVSCDAFGADFHVRFDEPSKCVRCDDGRWALLLPMALLGGAFVLLATALAAYVRLVTRYPDTIRKVVMPLPVGAYAPPLTRYPDTIRKVIIALALR